MRPLIKHCENCGDDLGDPVKKEYGDFVTCGKPACNRAERDFYAEQREAAHEQLDRDMGYGNY